MSRVGGPLLVAALALVFAGLHGLAARMPPRRRSLPFWAFGVLLGAATFEATRYDHGRGDLLFAVAYVAAPVVAIFGGALWGARRFHGWPDLGPAPGRAAGVAALAMLGVLAGTSMRERDVRATERRAEALREEVVALRAGGGGAWPPALPAGAPRTRLGWWDPPPFAYEVSGDRATLRFRLSSGRSRALDLEKGEWTTERTP
jgi:hypothetical protein